MLGFFLSLISSRYSYRPHLSASSFLPSMKYNPVSPVLVSTYKSVLTPRPHIKCIASLRNGLLIVSLYHPHFFLFFTYPGPLLPPPCLSVPCVSKFLFPLCLLKLIVYVLYRGLPVLVYVLFCVFPCSGQKSIFFFFPGRNPWNVLNCALAAPRTLKSRVSFFKFGWSFRCMTPNYHQPLFFLVSFSYFLFISCRFCWGTFCPPIASRG